MNDVRIPIQTMRDGTKITKMCVEDVYKIINRLLDSMNKAFDNSVNILNSKHQTIGDCEGEFIIGNGTSQPCLGDAFDEAIGSNIAFMKAKLNANIKKHNMIVRVWNEFVDLLDSIDDELQVIDEYIKMDLNHLRIYNPDYLTGIEEKLSIYETEQEEDEEFSEED